MPTLPAEGTYSDVERSFIENSPEGMWPENQDSNFGQFRKVLCDELQTTVDKLTVLADELFIQTATDAETLALWEEMLDLPPAPGGKTEAQRRAILAPRLQYGPFTHARRKAVLDFFIAATLGESITLTTAGVPLDAAGTPLFSGETSLAEIYRIYENVRNFSYEVWIENTSTPDLPALTRELERITPGGISFTIDNSRANVLDYFRTIRNSQPVWYSRLSGNANDASGYGNNGTLNGTPTSVASPGLLDAAVADGSGAYDFDGVDDHITVPDANQLDVGDHFSFEAWVRLDTTPSINYRIFEKGSGAPDILVNSGTRNIVLLKSGQPAVVTSTIGLTLAAIHHIVVTKRGPDVHIYIDGVDRTGTIANQVFVNTTSVLRIGGFTGNIRMFDGAIDEPAVYNHALSATEVKEHYDVGRNVWPS